MSSPDKKLVLIVDDTPTNVAVVSGVLKDSFRTKVATNGEKALAIANSAEKPDLILLDVTMPALSRHWWQPSCGKNPLAPQKQRQRWSAYRQQNDSLSGLDTDFASIRRKMMLPLKARMQKDAGLIVLTCRYGRSTYAACLPADSTEVLAPFRVGFSAPP